LRVNQIIKLAQIAVIDPKFMEKIAQRLGIGQSAGLILLHFAVDMGQGVVQHIGCQVLKVFLILFWGVFLDVVSEGVGVETIKGFIFLLSLK